MTSNSINRILLPCAMGALLLFSLSYWWLENVPHEVLGTAMFALLAWHITVNRFWFKNLLRGKYDSTRTFVVGLHLALIINMIILLFTSIVISKFLFSALPIPDSIYLREIHWFSAYWVMMIVGIHLGIHWKRVMTLTRSFLGLSTNSTLRTYTLRLIACGLLCLGVWSFFVLGIWNKLTFTYSIEFWNFKTSVAPFFLHWVAVVSVPAMATHYGMILWRKYRRTNGSTRVSYAHQRSSSD